MKEQIKKLKEQNKLLEKFSSKMLINLLHLIMIYNVFKFRDNYFLQIIGYDMVIYCIANSIAMYYGFKEEFEIYLKFNNSLTLDKQQVYYFLGLQKGNNEDYENLKDNMNDFRILKQ